MEHQMLLINQNDILDQYTSVIPAHLQEECEFHHSSFDPNEKLLKFLQNAIHNWNPSEMIRKYILENGEEISCVCWKQRFYITGTDIVKVIQFRFLLSRLPIYNIKKFEEGVFSDLRNLKAGTDSSLEEPRSPFLEFLYHNGCIRTQKKQKVFFWLSVPHERLFKDALERELRRRSIKKVNHGTQIRSFSRSINDIKSSKLHHSLPISETLESQQVPIFAKAIDKIPYSIPVQISQYNCSQSYPYIESSWISSQYESTSSQPHHSYQLSSNIPKSESLCIDPFTSNDIAECYDNGFGDNIQELKADSDLDLYSNNRDMMLEYSQVIDEQSPSWASTIHNDQSDIASSILIVKDEYNSQKEYSHDLFMPLSPFDIFVQDSNPFNLDLQLMSDSIAKNSESSKSTVESSNVDVYSLSDAQVQLSTSTIPNNAMSICNETQNNHLNMLQRCIINNAQIIDKLSAHQSFRNSQNTLCLRENRAVSLKSQQSFSYDKGYVCNFDGCGRSFKRIEHLKRHHRTHTGEKSYVCPVEGCRKSFSRSDNLSQHSKVHIQSYDKNMVRSIQQYYIVNSHDCDGTMFA